MRAPTEDGLNLYYEEVGNGQAIVFVHEFAGDHTSWEPQMRHFGKTHRCLAFAARGFTPSDVPGEGAFYTQDKAADDILAVMDAAGIEKAHVVGLSMGALATLHFGLRHAQRARSLFLGGCGYGSDLQQLQAFRDRSELTGEVLQILGMEAFAPVYCAGVGRVQFQNKDPVGHRAFMAALAAHDTLGSSLTQRFLQGGRPSIYTLEDDLARLDVPAMVAFGDEDFPCFEPGFFLKRTIPSAALAVIPNSGHSINQEEPDGFNRLLERFLFQVEAGRWPMRDTRALQVPEFGSYVD